MNDNRQVDGSNWRTNITELMSIFRDSLVALVPTLDRARISWRKPDAYDDWDEIVEALYRSIVIRSIECSFPDEPTIPFPKYGFQYEQYQDVSFIDVRPESGGCTGFLLFVEFETFKSPFDTIECCHIDGKGRVLQKEWVKIPLNRAVFRCHRRVSQNELSLLDSLSVFL